LELAEFLGREGNPPEQQALLRLIGTMVDGTFEAGTSANSNAKA
jgi:hypothetical protein